jgi:hypothetical protein
VPSSRLPSLQQEAWTHAWVGGPHALARHLSLVSLIAVPFFSCQMLCSCHPDPLTAQCMLLLLLLLYVQLRPVTTCQWVRGSSSASLGGAWTTTLLLQVPLVAATMA